MQPWYKPKIEAIKLPPQVLACAHGLTRNARDFDCLGEALAPRYRVVCIDFPGRGRSDWLTDSTAYNVAFYASVAATWLAAVGAERVHWLGTSMGGLVGIWLASQQHVPLRSLIANDVGPEVPAAAMQRIADYVGMDFRFDSLRGLETHLRMVHAPFGPLSDAHWAHLATHSQRRLADGAIGFHYDPRIADALGAARESGVDLWLQWRACQVPALLLRGAESDVLPQALAERMLEALPSCTTHCFPGIGHAPALMDEAQIDIVGDWLAAQDDRQTAATHSSG